MTVRFRQVLVCFEVQKKVLSLSVVLKEKVKQNLHFVPTKIEINDSFLILRISCNLIEAV